MFSDFESTFLDCMIGRVTSKIEENAQKDFRNKLDLLIIA
jgi:hypothetical protein